MAQGNYSDAGLSPEIERLSEQLTRNPNSKLFIPLAEEYMKSDMAEEAIMTLEEGLKAHPGYMSARVLLGKAHLQKGDMDNACVQFEAVVKAVPDNLYAHKKLGEIYLAQKRRDEALKAYKILYLLSPKDEDISDIISQLESGNMPPSPLSVAEQDKVKQTAGKTAAPAPRKAVVKAASPETHAPVKAAGDAAPVESPAPEKAVVKAASPETHAPVKAAEEAAPVETPAPEKAMGEDAPAEVAGEQSAPPDEADFDIGEAEQEELEGSAPVYEIDEDIAGLESEELGVEIPGPEDDILGSIDSAPGPDQESPFDIGDKIPYESGGEQPLDLDKQAPAEEAVGLGEQGGYNLDTGMGMGAGPNEPMFEEPEPVGGASTDEELQEIFSSYGGGQPGGSSEEAGDSVYEIDEPSDIDLEELGVKTSMNPASKAEDTGPSGIQDMPFEVEGESDMTVPAEVDFSGLGAGDEGDSKSLFDTAGTEDVLAEESPLDEGLPFDIGGGETELESPFETAVSEEAPVEELPFDLGGDDTDMESPFAAAKAGDAAVEELPFDLGGGETDMESPFGAVESGSEVISEPSGELVSFEAEEAAEGQEPIKTDTLAEMYIRQGFYDRAISIYKEMLKDNPGNLSIKQKLEELYMLAGLGSAKKVSEQAEAPGSAAVVEPADFVLDAQARSAVEDDASVGALEAGEGETAGDTSGPEVAVRLGRFLENIRRKAGR